MNDGFDSWIFLFISMEEPGDNKALSSFHKLLRNPASGGHCGGSGVNQPPTHTVHSLAGGLHFT